MDEKGKRNRYYIENNIIFHSSIFIAFMSCLQWIVMNDFLAKNINFKTNKIRYFNYPGQILRLVQDS